MENQKALFTSTFPEKEKEKEHRIVCIGASAGGMEAIHEIFDNMPADTGFSFIVIQHLSSDHKSLMAELLAKHTAMNVAEARDNTAIEPNVIYVIPNNRNITIENSKLLLSQKEEGRSPNMAIDIFLRSLAEDVGKRAIAVILSGTGTDGTKGIAAVKNAGGLVFAQDPTTAKFDGMPLSAISSGNIDFILSPESIADELLNHYKSAPKSIIVDSLSEEDEPVLQEIFELIHARTSSDFKYYKRPTLIRRLTRRMAVLNGMSLKDYLEHLRQHIDEVNLLRKEFLIGVTRFFRDARAFEELSLKVIPEISKGKSASEIIKIWVAGCSTGEEAYSIGMLMREHLNRIGAEREIKIFASDTNKEAIEFASRGVYHDSIANDVPPDFLDRYFIREDKRFRVSPQLRKMIVFSHHDLLKNAPFSRLDLICCRNMLIYVSPQVQSRIMSLFHFSLNLGGYLFLGPSENIGDLKDYVQEVSKKWKIFKNIKPAKSIGLEPVSFPESTTKKFAPPQVKITRELSRKVIVETVLNKVMEECSLAGALVDPAGNIVETFGNYRKFLHLPEKKFDNNLLKMLPSKAAILVGAHLRKAVHTGERFSLDNVKFGQHFYASVTVKPFHDNFNNLNVLVLFNEEKPQPAIELTHTNGNGNGTSKHKEELVPDFQDFLSLEAELRETKEILQKAIEDSETSYEELQSANEELISSNEELQSANEELQSLNEELHTVNAENQLRIKEISDLNDDLNNYFRSTDIGQIFLDNNLIIRKFTPAATLLVNLIDSDIGRPISHISNNIAYGGLIHDVTQVLKTSEPVSKVIQANNHVWYQMKIQAYLREGKIYDGAVLTFVDITAIKIAESKVEKINRELKELNQNLLKSNKELEQFAYITSHDLQEPLRKIQTFVELTQRNLSNETVSTRYLDKISTSASRMSMLIKDVLSYSRLTRSEERFVETDLNSILESVIIDYDLLIEQKHATINSAELPVIRGIPLQIQQLFSNLIGNSLKFCEQKPEINIDCEAVSAPQVAEISELDPHLQFVKLIFKDNGIGFDQQYANKVFTIFQRLNHRSVYPGTGIGLALCKRIVENHHGAIFANSALDCGTTFEIYLPLSIPREKMN